MHDRRAPEKEKLLQITDKAARRAKLFQSQLSGGQGDLENNGWFF